MSRKLSLLRSPMTSYSSHFHITSVFCGIYLCASYFLCLALSLNFVTLEFSGCVFFFLTLCWFLFLFFCWDSLPPWCYSGLCTWPSSLSIIDTLLGWPYQYHGFSCHPDANGSQTFFSRKWHLSKTRRRWESKPCKYLEEHHSREWK